MLIGFLMDDILSIDNPAMDSTLHLVREAVRRGHETSVIYPRNLTVRASDAYIYDHRIVSPAGKDVASFVAGLSTEDGMRLVSDLDVLFCRVDPPIDPQMFHFLDVVGRDVFVVNGVDGMRRASSKFHPLVFYTGDDPLLLPETHISRRPAYLRRVLDESPGRYMVLKPLDGAGGRGVIVLDKEAPRNTDSLLDFYTGGDGQNYVVLQEYLPEAQEGDVRVLVLAGEPVGAMRRVPAAGDNRANIHAGGRPEPYELTQRDREVIAAMRPRLLADELYFAGIDLIGGRLVEVNVRSPGGIPRINALTGTRVEERVITFVEEEFVRRQSGSSE